MRSTRSAPTLQNQCQTLDTQGRCSSSCASGPFILGRGLGGAPGPISYGVQLIDSPGALISENGICSGGFSGDAVGVRITGAAAGTLLRANLIDAFNGSQSSVGVWMDPCGGASPWLFNNTQIGGSAGAPQGLSDGVRAIGD